MVLLDSVSGNLVLLQLVIVGMGNKGAAAGFVCFDFGFYFWQRQFCTQDQSFLFLLFVIKPDKSLPTWKLEE